MGNRDNLLKGRIAGCIGLAYGIKTDEDEAPVTRMWARLAHWALRRMAKARENSRDGL